MVGPDDTNRESADSISSGAENCDWAAVMPIGTASRRLSLSVSALRKYETEGLIVYQRTPAARRLLAPADLDRIRRIQSLIGDCGLNMEGIRRLVALIPCWELMPCTPEDRRACSAAVETTRPCWMTEQTECARRGMNCRQCRVYRKALEWLPNLKALLHDPAIRAAAAADQFNPESDC